MCLFSTPLSAISPLPTPIISIKFPFAPLIHKYKLIFINSWVKLEQWIYSINIYGRSLTNYGACFYEYQNTYRHTYWLHYIFNKNKKNTDSIQLWHLSWITVNSCYHDTCSLTTNTFTINTKYNSKIYQLWVQFCICRWFYREMSGRCGWKVYSGGWFRGKCLEF